MKCYYCRWKNVLHDPSVGWLAAWPRHPSTATYCYMTLSPAAKLQQQSSKEKFEMARKLKHKVGEIRQAAWNNMRSEFMKERQLAVVVYLIDKLALRVGTEKNLGDGADTVNLTPVFFVFSLFCVKIL